MDPRALLAGINDFEFHYREADFGSYPKGLIYGLDLLDTWLYDETSVWTNLDISGLLEELKKEIHTGYFEKLIRRYLLDNTHTSTVLLLPEKGLTERMEEQQKEKLAAFAASLSEEELEELRRRKRNSGPGRIRRIPKKRSAAFRCFRGRI